MGLSEVLHKIVDVAAGVGQRQDLHDEIDDLDSSAEAAPEPPSGAEPAEGAAPEPSEPVAAPEPAPPADVQEPVQEPVQVHVQEDGSSGEADA